MITILSQQPAAAADAPSASVEVPDPQDMAGAPESDSEWVAGPRQLTALAFVAIAAVALFASVSYLAGKAAAAQSEALPAIQLNLAQPVPPQPSIGDQFASSATAPIAKAPDAPVFADPQPGKTYIQMAAVEHGVAAVFAEGLRAHGLTAFVAPGPPNTPNIYRVLIGPVTDTQAYTADKMELDKIGLATFMRQYEK